MVSLAGYKLLHLMAIFALFIAFGAAMVPIGQKRRWPMVLHGVALFFILFAGFGMLGLMGITWPFPGWVFAKLAIWVVLGGSIALAKRRLVPPAALTVLLVFLGGLAAYFALWKPF